MVPAVRNGTVGWSPHQSLGPQKTVPSQGNHHHQKPVSTSPACNHEPLFFPSLKRNTHAPASNWDQIESTRGKMLPPSFRVPAATLGNMAADSLCFARCNLGNCRRLLLTFCSIRGENQQPVNSRGEYRLPLFDSEKKKCDTQTMKYCRAMTHQLQ